MQAEVLALHLTLNQAVQSYLLDLKTYAQPGTIENYRYALGELEAYAQAHNWPELAWINADDLREFLVATRTRPRWNGERDRADPKPISASYYETLYRRLKTFFNWCLYEEYIQENPMGKIRRPKLEERIIPVVTDEDWRRLLQTAATPNNTRSEQFRAVRNTALLYVLADTSLRKEGVTGLTLEDVDLDARTLLVMEKGRKERLAYIGNAATKALWRYMVLREQLRPYTDSLWVDSTGAEMTSNWVYLFLKRLGARAGVPHLHTHRFRHTFATTMLENGTPLPVLEHAAGWSKAPKTYLRNIGDRAAREWHQRVSPGDRIAKAAARRR